jgi:hypothetical protein
MEHWRNDNGRIRLKQSERNLSHYRTVYYLGSKLGLWGERRATSRPNSGAAVFVMLKAEHLRCVCWLYERIQTLDKLRTP